MLEGEASINDESLLMTNHYCLIGYKLMIIDYILWAITFHKSDYETLLFSRSFIIAFIPEAINCPWFRKMSQLMRLWSLSHRHQRRLRRACASAQSRQGLLCSHTWSMEVDEGSDQNQTSSLTGWLRMSIWRMRLRRTSNHNLMSRLKYQLKCQERATSTELRLVTRKPVFGVLRPGKTQTGLLSYRS